MAQESDARIRLPAQGGRVVTRRSTKDRPCIAEGFERGSLDFAEVLRTDWLGGRDSNPDTQIQSLQSYH